MIGRWRGKGVENKLARIDGALVPLAPRGLPPAPRGSLGSFRSPAKAGDWRRMRFILTDRSEVADDCYFQERMPYGLFVPTKEKGRSRQ